MEFKRKLNENAWKNKEQKEIRIKNIKESYGKYKKIKKKWKNMIENKNTYNRCDKVKRGVYCLKTLE